MIRIPESIAGSAKTSFQIEMLDQALSSEENLILQSCNFHFSSRWQENLHEEATDADRNRRMRLNLELVNNRVLRVIVEKSGFDFLIPVHEMGKSEISTWMRAMPTGFGRNDDLCYGLS